MGFLEKGVGMTGYDRPDILNFNQRNTRGSGTKVLSYQDQLPSNL